MSRAELKAVVGDWMVSYWVDHAVREIRVTNLERIE